MRGAGSNLLVAPGCSAIMDISIREGKYIDNFFISIPGTIAAVQNDCIYGTEQDKDGNMQVVKYKIAEK